MSILKWLFKPDPQDAENRKTACEANRKAEEQLQRASRLREEAALVSGKLRDTRIENHFGPMIRESFQLKPPKRKRPR